MTKTFQLILSPISLNNRNIYNVIYNNLHKSDATVFAFVDYDKKELDYYRKAFKHFYDEPNIYFIGIENDPNNITDELIDVAIDVLNKSNLPLDGYTLVNVFKSRKDEKVEKELKQTLDGMGLEEEEKEVLCQTLTGRPKRTI